MIVKIQVIINVDPQKCNTVFIFMEQLETWISKFSSELKINSFFQP